MKGSPGMAFSDYKTLSQVQKEFRVKYQEAHFIQGQEVEPPALFREEFAFSLEHIDVYTSEAARTEAVIFPILREVYKHYYDIYSLWIQKPIVLNERLSGTPDYVIGTKSALGKTVLETPLVIIVEAKKNDFEQGWAQCLAELVAAQGINAPEEGPVYGIVTDGRLWEFGKLAGDTFTKHSEAYTVDQLARLFGVLHFIFRSASRSNATVAA
jgi:hypothetical protein